MAASDSPLLDVGPRRISSALWTFAFRFPSCVVSFPSLFQPSSYCTVYLIHICSLYRFIQYSGLHVCPFLYSSLRSYLIRSKRKVSRGTCGCVGPYTMSRVKSTLHRVVKSTLQEPHAPQACPRSCQKNPQKNEEARRTMESTPVLPFAAVFRVQPLSGRHCLPMALIC